MARFSHPFWLWPLIGAIVLCRAATFAVERDFADRDFVNSVSQRRSGLPTANLSTIRGHSLYWFFNVSVGDSQDLKLLIDTGSTDLILNRGVYKPSTNETKFKGRRIFHTGYEGVNRAGFGTETLSGKVQVDVATAGNLTVKDQAIGSVTKWKYQGVKQLPYANQGDGIIGFVGPTASGFRPKAYSWIWNLAFHNLILEKRFGLAFGTSGKGSMIIGELASQLVEGNFTSVPHIPRRNYIVNGDVTLNNTIILTDQILDLDCGTDNVQGPIKKVKAIFEKLGYESVLTKESRSLHVLQGFFPCNDPPTLGFSFPAQSELKDGEKAEIFNVSPKVWDVFNNGNNNCTSILGGINGYDEWLVGQSFFSGHYVDFNLETKVLSFANLKDPETGGMME